MRIGGRRPSDESGAPSPAPGPWSDPPPDETRRATPPLLRQPWLKPRRGGREPIIGNWKGLIAVLFLLLVAPPLARVLSGVILGLIHAR